MRKSKILLSGGVLLCLILAGCGSGGNDSGKENVKDVVENLLKTWMILNIRLYARQMARLPRILSPPPAFPNG